MKELKAISKKLAGMENPGSKKFRFFRNEEGLQPIKEFELESECADLDQEVFQVFKKIDALIPTNLTVDLEIDADTTFLSIQYCEGDYAASSVNLDLNNNESILDQLECVNWEEHINVSSNRLSGIDDEIAYYFQFPACVPETAALHRDYSFLARYWRKRKEKSYSVICVNPRYRLEDYKWNKDFTALETDERDFESLKLLESNLVDILALGLHPIGVVVDGHELLPNEIDKLKSKAIKMTKPNSLSRARAELRDFVAHMQERGVV